MMHQIATLPQRALEASAADVRHFVGDDISREYVAEAIRAYMADPNYIKTVAPKTAARIREFVNSNPDWTRSSSSTASPCRLVPAW